MSDLNILEALKITANKSKDYANNNYVNVLIGSARGEIIGLDDVSPLTHKIPVKMRSKNLFDISKVSSNTNVTNNGDGTLSVFGYGVPIGKFSKLLPSVNVGDVVTLSLVTNACASSGEALDCFYLNGMSALWKSGTAITVTQDVLDGTISAYCKRSTDGVNTTATTSNIQIELGTTATPYTSYVTDDTEVTVKSLGKNQFDISQEAHFKHYAISSIEKTSDTITLNIGYSNISNLFYISAQYVLPSNLAGKEITVSVNASTSGVNKAHIRVAWVNSVGTTVGDMLIGGHYSGQIPQKMTLTGIVPQQPDADHNKLVLYLYAHGSEKVLQNGETYTTTYSNIQIEIGNTATEYEPYKEGETVNTTVVESVELTSIAPNMTITTNNEGIIIDAVYNRDFNRVVEKLTQAIISLGGTV